MCGLSGVFEYGRAVGSVTPDVVVAMRDVLRHRGPDGEGLFVSEDRRLGLGHRRLSILDLEHGAQPMFGRGGTCLVFNGEIYNYPALRRELERDGVAFKTTCDTEVILHLYERHGEACVDHLNGMFAFALWDPQAESLLLCRDRLGEKPLYWADVGGRLVFGSEIKALLQHPSVVAEVNAEALPSYLAHLVVPSPETLYAGIHKLAPGTLATCTARGVNVRRYWHGLATREFADVSLEDATEAVRAGLETSTRDRLLSDVPVGVLLSGGLDSTALVALLRERAEGLATFSVGFADHPEIDERAEAARVAEHFRTDHHEVSVTESEALGFLDGMVHHQDEPLADPVCLPLHFVCALAQREGVKVVLAGEGSDEMFWGYPAYVGLLRQWRWARAVLRLPGPVRRALPRGVRAGEHPYFRERLEALAGGRHLPGHFPPGLWRHHRETLLSGDAGEMLPGWSPAAAAPGEKPLHRLLFDTQEYEFGVRLPELLLMRIDRFSMANSVEARVPFLDPGLVELAYRLPLEHKLAGTEGKVVLRRALAGLVPQHVLERRKQGFGAPVRKWMGSELGGLFRELLEGEALRRYFDTTALRAALERDRGVGANPALWPIMNFALWHRYWIEGHEDAVPAGHGVAERTGA
jgi:asparagine synthase (glutamine-hydrolysing)